MKAGRAVARRRGKRQKDQGSDVQISCRAMAGVKWGMGRTRSLGTGEEKFRDLILLE